MVTNTVWLNGKLIPQSRARLQVNDAGFLCGDGVFETVAARDGHLVAPQRHWHRLVYSCRALHLHTVAPDEFEAALWAVLGCSGLKEARLRFSISRGHGGRQTFLATVTEMPEYAAAAKVLRSAWQISSRGPLVGVKSLSYAGSLRMLEEARKAGADEALVGNEFGHLCEGSVSNVFVAIGGRLLTPALHCGCLPGITRGLVIESCLAQGLRIEEADLPWEQSDEIEEAFLTSSLRGVQPVSQWLGRNLPSPGPLTQRAMQAYQLALAEMRGED